MFQANPFFEETLHINEANPIKYTRRKNLKGIAIGPDPENYSAKPNIIDINKLLRSIKEPGQIKLIEISYDSQLKALPEIELFPNIEYAHIGGRKISKYDKLFQFNKLKSLFLVNFKETSLEGFYGLSLENFRAIRGRLETFDIPADSVFLQTCNNLVDFHEVEIRFLMIEGCQKVSLNSLTRILGLNELHLLGRNEIPSFDFINECRELQNLVITATDLKQTDLQAIILSPRLKYVFLGNVPNSTISFLGKGNKNISITNGDFYYFRGEECDYYEYMNKTE